MNDLTSLLGEIYCSHCDQIGKLSGKKHCRNVECLSGENLKLIHCTGKVTKHLTGKKEVWFYWCAYCIERYKLLDHWHLA